MRPRTALLPAGRPASLIRKGEPTTPPTAGPDRPRRGYWRCEYSPSQSDTIGPCILGEWLLEDVYADREHVYLFLGNCSIHHTKAVRKYMDDHCDRLTVIWNATYAPNLNLIERFWGHLKRSAIHNHYFETVENLEKAIMQAVRKLNRRKNHPLRLHLQTVQTLSKAA